MKKRQFRPTMDGVLENRLVMSGGIPLWHGLPILTTHTYNQVLSAVGKAFVTFSHSDGSAAAFNRLEDALDVQANRLPFGNRSLVATGAIDAVLAGITPGTAGAFFHDTIDGLQDYIGTGLADGDFVFLQSHDHHASDNDFPRNGHVK
jgi:hypothetical protein